MRHFLKKAAGPYYGPRGGKWADAAHTIPWRDKGAQAVPVEQGAEHDVKPHEALGMSPFKLKVERVDGDMAHVSFGGGSTTPVPAKSVQLLVNDLQGIVHGKPSEHANINAVLDGKATFLGKGDDGLAFKHHGRVVKVSTTVPYQPTNAFHKTPERAVQVAKEQHQTLNAMREAGVPGLLAEKFVEHDGRAYTIRPYVDLPKKLTAEHLEKVHDSIEAMHKHGFVLGDEIQVGMHDGEPVLFDVGKAEKSSRPQARERDQERLEALYREHGQEFTPRGADVSKRWESKLRELRFLKPKTPEHKERVRKQLHMLAAAMSKEAPDDLEREIIQDDLTAALEGLDKAMPIIREYLLIKAGPYYGPRGGKWADAAHTIPWQGEHKKVLFHSAPAHAMESIQEHGLTPRKGAGLFQHGGYGEHSQGKVFLSDNYSAAKEWHGKVHDQLFDQHDDAKMHDAVMLRVKHRKTSVDTVGNDDVEGSRITEKAIPPHEIEYFDKKHGWRSVQNWKPGKHEVPRTEADAHHSGFESKAIVERDKKVAAENAAHAAAQSKVHAAADAKAATEHKAFVAEWRAKPAADREAKGKELAGQKSMIPGRSRLNMQWREALGVNEKGEIEQDESKITKLYKALKLHRRREFQGMLISVENQAGSYRHWKNSHDGTSGKTLMKFDYGYIRRTEGTDGDHVDVFVGPNKEAPFVYVVTTMQAPDFLEIDEQKCMLGFDSLHDAREAFYGNYNDRRFLGEIRMVPLQDFRDFVLNPKNHGQLVKGYVVQKRLHKPAALPDMEGIYGAQSAVESEEKKSALRRKIAAKRNKGKYGFHGKAQVPTKRYRVQDWPSNSRPATR